MANIVLPYNLQEGTKAYAAKVMANLHAIIGQLNNVDIVGLPNADLKAVLQAIYDLVSAAVVAYQTGNADQILFDDGDTMQEKVDRGDFNGLDGVSLQLNGLYHFKVENGNLILYAPDDVGQPPFSIVNGELIYEIPDPETEEIDVASYNLGRVKGENGDGDMAKSVYDPTRKATDIFAYIDSAVDNVSKSQAKSCYVYAAAWDGSKQAIVELAEMGANTNFVVGTAYNATAEQDEAWDEAHAKVIAQASGSFTLKARGGTPAIDIPLTVLIHP